MAEKPIRGSMEPVNFFSTKCLPPCCQTLENGLKVLKDKIAAFVGPIIESLVLQLQGFCGIFQPRQDEIRPSQSQSFPSSGSITESIDQEFFRPAVQKIEAKETKIAEDAVITPVGPGALPSQPSQSGTLDQSSSISKVATAALPIQGNPPPHKIFTPTIHPTTVRRPNHNADVRQLLEEVGAKFSDNQTGDSLDEQTRNNLPYLARTTEQIRDAISRIDRSHVLRPNMWYFNPRGDHTLVHTGTLIGQETYICAVKDHGYVIQTYSDWCDRRETGCYIPKDCNLDKIKIDRNVNTRLALRQFFYSLNR